MEHWSKLIDQGNSVDIVYLDLDWIVYLDPKKMAWNGKMAACMLVINFKLR